MAARLEELFYESSSKEEKKQQSKKLGNGDKITDWNKFTEFAKKHGGIGNG